MERKKLIVLCPCPCHVSFGWSGQDSGIALNGDPPCQNPTLFHHPGEEILGLGVWKIIISQI